MEAVIFDCDGVLVDSEPVYAKAFSLTLADFGCDISAELLRGELRGKSMKSCYEWLLDNYDFDVSESFIRDLFAASDRLLEAEVQPVTGVADIVRQVTVKKAVASNGVRCSVLGNLARCGLAPYFGEHVYTADSVPAPKPAPDIYLHAAKSLGVQAEQCIVVEDSPLGVEAAIASGMAVCCVTHGELSASDVNEQAHLVCDMAGVSEWLREQGAL